MTTFIQRLAQRPPYSSRAVTAPIAGYVDATESLQALLIQLLDLHIQDLSVFLFIVAFLQE